MSSTHLGSKTRFLLLSDSCVCSCGAPSLTIGRVCSLQLLLAIASEVTLGPNPAGFMTIFYCLRLDTPPTWTVRTPYLCPPGTGWPSYTPRHRVPFSSPPTTRRATVEVFKPISTWGWTLIKVKVEVKVTSTLWLAVYCQSVRLGAKPLEVHDQRFFSTEPLRS
jgi:hypothetical protein